MKNKRKQQQSSISLKDLVNDILVDALKEALKSEKECNQEETPSKRVALKRYVYGLKGLSDLLGCSISTAQRVKSSGVIDAAISQTFKTIVIDADLALDLLRLSNNKWGTKSSK